MATTAPNHVIIDELRDIESSIVELCRMVAIVTEKDSDLKDDKDAIRYLQELACLFRIQEKWLTDASERGLTLHWPLRKTDGKWA